MLEAEAASRQAQHAADETLQIREHSKQIALNYLRGKGVRTPTDNQLRKVMSDPKVIELAKQRIKDERTL
jgi:hypothetical protein